MVVLSDYQSRIIIIIGPILLIQGIKIKSLYISEKELKKEIFISFLHLMTYFDGSEFGVRETMALIPVRQHNDWSPSDILRQASSFVIINYNSQTKFVVMGGRGANVVQIL